MTGLADILAGGHGIAAHRPWPRAVIDSTLWRRAILHLAAGDWTLLGLWGEADMAHMAVRDAGTEIAVLSIACPDRQYPSVGALHAPAIRLERSVRDLFGLDPVGLPDTRPWLDHGNWGVRHPLGQRTAETDAPENYLFLPALGENLHEIPVGPVHAGIIEPGHFRFTADGETVVRLEARLGYTHKGLESLLAGADIMRAGRLAGRGSGDSTVAYAIAFARAVEAALDAPPPPRAVWLRAVMAELERLANHLGDFGAICNDAAFAIMLAHCGILRERVLRTAAACFGHRLMMDRVVPGGTDADLDADGITRIRALLGDIGTRLPPLVELYDKTVSLQDRTVATGVLHPDLARRFGCGGVVGRASGQNIDARKHPGYPPYDRLDFTVKVLHEGDVNARIWIRIAEIEQSLKLIEQLLDLPAGPTKIELTGGSGEGMALAEGFRGDILVWLRIAADGRIARCHIRDPSWFQWPVLEAAIYGNIVADFPLCNKSFNCSYSGSDL
jgi:Ni,Fe-hydrogenase III large subunit